MLFSIAQLAQEWSRNEGAKKHHIINTGEEKLSPTNLPAESPRMLHERPAPLMP